MSRTKVGPSEPATQEGRSGAAAVAKKRWSTPQIVEIRVGLEINGYASAELSGRSALGPPSAHIL